MSTFSYIVVGGLGLLLGSSVLNSVDYTRKRNIVQRGVGFRQGSTLTRDSVTGVSDTGAGVGLGAMASGLTDEQLRKAGFDVDRVRESRAAVDGSLRPDLEAVVNQDGSLNVFPGGTFDGVPVGDDARPNRRVSDEEESMFHRFFNWVDGLTGNRISGVRTGLFQSGRGQALAGFVMGLAEGSTSNGLALDIMTIFAIDELEVRGIQDARAIEYFIIRMASEIGWVKKKIPYNAVYSMRLSKIIASGKVSDYNVAFAVARILRWGAELGYGGKLGEALKKNLPTEMVTALAASEVTVDVKELADKAEKQLEEEPTPVEVVSPVADELASLRAQVTELVEELKRVKRGNDIHNDESFDPDKRKGPPVMPPRPVVKPHGAYGDVQRRIPEVNVVRLFKGEEFVGNGFVAMSHLFTIGHVDDIFDGVFFAGKSTKKEEFCAVATRKALDYPYSDKVVSYVCKQDAVGLSRVRFGRVVQDDTVTIVARKSNGEIVVSNAQVRAINPANEHGYQAMSLTGTAIPGDSGAPVIKFTPNGNPTLVGLIMGDNRSQQVNIAMILRMQDFRSGSSAEKESEK
jgi:hypothetical protein